jgi:hypothetical protein
MTKAKSYPRSIKELVAYLTMRPFVVADPEGLLLKFESRSPGHLTFTCVESNTPYVVSLVARKLEVEPGLRFKKDGFELEIGDESFMYRYGERK